MHFKKPIKESLAFTIGLLLWILVYLPLGVLVILPLRIFRLIVHFFAKYFQPDLIPLTNAVDSVIVLEPSSAFPVMNAAQVWKIQGKLDVSEFRQHFYKLFLSDEDLREKYRNFYCYFVQWCGYCFKKPVETIVLEDQIQEHKLKDGETLDGFIGKWTATSDYAKKPNWEILIIHTNQKNHEKSDGNEEDSWESVLLFKIDHGLCDGYSFVHLVEKLSGVKSPYIVSKEEISVWTKIKYIVSSATYSLTYILDGLKIKDPFLPLKNKDPDWFISFTTLDLEQIKNIRRKTGTHFNTVVGMFQVGAYRRYLLETGKATSIEQLPEYTWLPSPLAMPNHPSMIQGGMTNHLTVGLTRVLFRNEDRLVRLLAAEKDHQEFVERGMSKSMNWFFFKILWSFPSPILRAYFKAVSKFRFLPIVHTLSPLMCSGERYKMLGHPVNHLYLPVLIPTLWPGIGIYVIPVSNSGQLDISITASSEIFKNREELDVFTKVYLREELDGLTEACERYI